MVTEKTSTGIDTLNGDQSQDEAMVKEAIVQIRISEVKKKKWQDRANELDKSMTGYVIDCVDNEISSTNILKLIEQLIKKKMDEYLKKKK